MNATYIYYRIVVQLYCFAFLFKGCINFIIIINNHKENSIMKIEM